MDAQSRLAGKPVAKRGLRGFIQSFNPIRLIKTLIVKFILLFFRTVFFFCPPSMIQKIFKGLYFFPFSVLINLVWLRVLHANHYRIMAIDWLEFVAKKRQDPNAMLHGVSMAQDIGLNTNNIQNRMLQKAEDRIYKFPKFGFLKQRLFNLRLIYQINQSDNIEPYIEAVSNSPEVGLYFYKRMWDYHTMRNGSQAANMARLYFSASNYQPKEIVYVWSKIFEPNGMSALTLDLIDKSLEIHSLKDEAMKLNTKRQALWETPLYHLTTLFSDQKTADTTSNLEIRQLKKLKYSLLVEEGTYDEATKLRSLFETDIDVCVATSRLIHEQDSKQAAIKFLTKMERIVANVAPDIHAAILGELGELHEEDKNFDIAMEYYRRANLIDKPDTYLASLSYPWRYMTGLMGLGRWSEALATMREGQDYMWANMHQLSSRSHKWRTKKDYPINANGALFLGGWGVGDETLRLSVLKNLKDSKAKVGVYVDPRLRAIAQRSMPDISFYSNSRVNGPFATDEYNYWRDREGVPAQYGYDRVSKQTLQNLESYPDVALTEDLMYNFIKMAGQYKASPEALFIPDPTHLETAQDWLESLPGKLNVGISWRSGQVSHVRNKSYTDIEEWESLFAIPGINFINLQYSDTTQEVKRVKKKFGVQIYNQPDVDLKNDIDQIMALSKAVDFVISPCTASLEFAGAVGTPTFALSITPWLPDLWRVNKDDKETDMFFPSIKHMAIYHYGSRKAVFAEIKRRLEENL